MSSREIPTKELRFLLFPFPPQGLTALKPFKVEIKAGCKDILRVFLTLTT